MKIEKVRLLMMYYASCQLQINIIDRLKYSEAYMNEVKKLSNLLLPKLEREISKLYEQKQMNNSAQDSFAQTYNAAQTFARAAANTDIDAFMHVVQKFSEGGIFMVEPDKHTKFLAQQKRLIPIDQGINKEAELVVEL